MNGEANDPKRPLRRDKIRELLVDLFEMYEPSFDEYQWPWENQRWYELVFCLLAAVEGQYGPDSPAATATRVLVDLDLLDVPVLAANQAAEGSAADSDSYLAHLAVVLQRSGFAPDQVDRLLPALCAAASAVQEKHGGKVQAALRVHSKLLIDRLTEELSLAPHLGAENAHLAITNWLQNVMNVPVPVPSKGLTAFCQRTGAQPADVIKMVDELDINVALLDEVLNQWFEGSGQPPETE